MEFIYRNCPHCDSALDADTEIFVQDGDVIGCEFCIRQTWADFDEDDDSEEAAIFWQENGWDDERYGL